MFTYLDKFGKEVFNNCWTCTKVCSKCPSGYYLNNKNQCKQLPKNCASADSNGKCKKCVSGCYSSGDKCVSGNWCYLLKEVNNGMILLYFLNL